MLKPKDSPSSGARVRELFLGALEKAGPERAAFLDSACAGDSTTRRRVEEMLKEKEEIGSFLETPAVAGLAGERLRAGLGNAEGGNCEAFSTVKPGDMIGRYKLLQVIGEGGCGVVYMAEQEEPVRRRVALKVIKWGMDTKQVIARFEAERQALALMDHPNIAKVLDAGATATGRPYFVMELVRGIKITEYCEEQQLSAQDRLKLFIPVCQAIQHAHQKGIIHRDIKPSNILVTLHDTIPVPKVIDFGIAKATEQRLTEKTLFTAYEQFLGTPAYMSPEQAEMSGLDIDTRTDIYALGVLLYELLACRTPFDPKELLASGLDGMRRTIRETEPIRPSKVVESRAAMRAEKDGPDFPLAALGAPQESLSTDLDWIVMKCLEKDRDRRYETANELAMDLQRCLEHEPVLARPPSASYRFRKFVRRHKAAVAASVTVAVVLVLAAAISGWLAVRAIWAEQEQNRLWKEADLARKNEARERERAETEKLAALRRAYNSDMNLAQQAMAANNIGRVVALLDRQRPGVDSQLGGLKAGFQPDFRQWEWRYYWHQSRSEASFELPRQPSAVEAVVVSPDGRLLVSSDRTGTMKLWDLASKTEVAVLRERGGGPAIFAYAPDGLKLAAVAGTDWRRSTIKVWTVATRQVAWEFTPEGRVEALAFSPDSGHLLILAHDLSVRSWDFAHDRMTMLREGSSIEGGRRGRAALSPDARWAAVPEGGRIRLLDLVNGGERPEIQAFEEGLASLAFSPDGQLLAAGPIFFGTNTTIKVFSTATSASVGALPGHVSWVPGLIFTPDGRHLVSAGADQSIRIWDAELYQPLMVLRGHRSEVNSVAVTSDGKTMISACKDGSMLGWELERLNERGPFQTLPRSVADLQFFPDGTQFLTLSAGLESSVSLWDTATLQEKERIQTLRGDVSRLLIAPDGSRVFAGIHRRGIKVIDWATRLVITNLAGGSRGADPIALIDQGRTLVTEAEEGLIELWDTATWKSRGSWKAWEGFRPSGPFGRRSRWLVSPDDRHLLVPNRNGGIEKRDLWTGQPAGTLPGQAWGIGSIAHSPNGRWLAASSGDGTVYLLDPGSGEIENVLRGHLLGVHAVAFSPDSERLASVSHGQEAVKLWDVSTWHEVATLSGEGSIFDFVKFSPDGKILVAVSREGRAHFWRAPSLEEIQLTEDEPIAAATKPAP